MGPPARVKRWVGAWNTGRRVKIYISHEVSCERLSHIAQAAADAAEDTAAGAAVAQAAAQGASQAAAEAAELAEVAALIMLPG